MASSSSTADCVCWKKKKSIERIHRAARSDSYSVSSNLHCTMKAGKSVKHTDSLSLSARPATSISAELQIDQFRLKLEKKMCWYENSMLRKTTLRNNIVECSNWVWVCVDACGKVALKLWFGNSRWSLPHPTPPHPAWKPQVSLSTHLDVDGKSGVDLQSTEYLCSFTAERCRSVLLNNQIRWGHVLNTQNEMAQCSSSCLSLQALRSQADSIKDVIHTHL